MTARTLEEIEREIGKLGAQKWYGAAHTLRLLAIAQEQRAELSAVFSAIDEVDAACEDQAYGWSERKDTARRSLQLLRNKHKIGTKR